MSASKQELIDALSNLKVLEVVDLIKALEEKWGVSAAAPVAVAAVGGAAAGGAAAPAAEEKTEFAVHMTAFAADKKVGVIKVIREITGLGLKEAKDMVEGVPSVVKEAVPKKDAEDIKKKLTEAGATADIK